MVIEYQQKDHIRYKLDSKSEYCFQEYLYYNFLRTENKLLLNKFKIYYTPFTWLLETQFAIN